MSESLLLQGQVGKWLLDEISGAALTQGPSMALIYEVATATVSYLGKSVTGSVTSGAVWQVRRLSFDGAGGVRIYWADGNGEYDNVWDNRASLQYL